MGSVSNYFTDFQNKSQVMEWRNLVYLTARRYIGSFSFSQIPAFLCLTKDFAASVINQLL